MIIPIFVIKARNSVVLGACLGRLVPQRGCLRCREAVGRAARAGFSSGRGGRHAGHCHRTPSGEGQGRVSPRQALCHPAGQTLPGEQTQKKEATRRYELSSL